MLMRRALAALLATAALAGCGITDPYRTSAAPNRATTATSKPAATPAPNDNDGPRTPPGPTAAAAASARAALERYASLYVNWQAGQLPQRARELQALATGQARAQALALATRAKALERYQVSNTGTVTAITPGQGQEQGRWAVITNETTSGTGPYAGLPATSHVTWATVAHQHHGYVVTGWYPAS
jgi:hypothetical protein